MRNKLIKKIHHITVEFCGRMTHIYKLYYKRNIAVICKIAVHKFTPTEFFGGRLATFVLFEWLLNLGVVLALGAILPEHMEFLTVDLTPYRGAGIEIVAMGIASVCNIVANYIIGKFLVFKKAKKENE